MNIRTLLALAIVVGSTAVACQSGERCVPGDQIACQCADGTYGYRTCARTTQDPGFAWGACDCVVGLSPDGGALSSPYTSGRGTGSGSTDGAADGNADASAAP